MTQKISYEDAFPTFKRRCTELFEANLLLEARADTLERQLSAALEENARLTQADQGTAEAGPCGGPDLAAVPPYPGEADS
ncbi:hypothetical protein [Streptomyces sp. NPDC005799]|uniref:hypothetical protein n=1 Tax=Streptomyces sp. NPDC005799 TaxID=3154678 RepID=UPI0033F644FF